MSRPRKLTPAECAALARDVPAWTLGERTLRREWKFRDFREAFAFLTRVAFEAEALNHHPDWSNSWASVTIALTTHDAGGLTELDFALARAIDRVFGEGDAKG